MDTTIPSSERPVSDGHRLPAVTVFDVNETLSDMSRYFTPPTIEATSVLHLARLLSQ